jgi:dTDP-4-amino-4,6-dideoxygalactose transaminase/predicted dehydrogenase
MARILLMCAEGLPLEAEIEGMTPLIKRGVRKLRREWARRSAVFRSPLRAGIVGCGAIAPEHLDGYEYGGQAVIVAASDVVPSNLARVLDRCPAARVYLDFRRMLDEVRPDVVSICTWPQVHAEAVAAAAAAGVRGILCEKPLALQLADLDRMRAACQQRAVKLAGGHQWRFHKNYMRAAEIIRSGSLGAVVGIRGNIKSTLANNGTHLIDTARFILGDPTAVRVTCRCRRERGEFNRGIPAEDAASGEILFSGGLLFEFLTGDLSPDFFTIIVEGRERTLEMTPQYLKVNGELCTPKGATVGDCRSRQFREFIRWVKGRSAGYPAEFEQGARAAELVLALYESARLGQPVRLPLPNHGDVIGELYSASACESKDTVPAAADFPRQVVTTSAGERLALDGGRRAVSEWFSAKPSIGASELANLTRVILSRNLSCTDGRMVPALEKEFARLYGSPHAVASTSGTAAVHVALGALALNPGDEVITTPMTDMGTIIPILANNCLPVFADVDPVTGNLTAESIARRITPRTRAVIVVHLFGFPADLAEIGELLRERGIPLIEDCAQAHYAEYRGKKVGTWGDLGCFSLQQSKQITCGDGGVTLVNRPDLAERASLFVDKGWDRKRGVRAHLFLGMNYRMTELQGAVALAQLRKLPRLIEARRAMADRLTERLRAITGVVPPPEKPGVVPSWWMYPFSIDESLVGMPIDQLAEALVVEGVRVRRQYLPEPLFEYDVLKHQRTYGDSRYPYSAFAYQPPDGRDFPGLADFGKRLLFLSWSHNVRPKHVDAIAAAVRKLAARQRVEQTTARRPSLRPEPARV